MERYSSSDDPLAALVSIPCSNEEKNSRKGNPGYSREFQAMLDSLEEEEELELDEEGRRSPSEKKRRLTLHQVKALEKNFEVGNKLEPEKKLKLAEDLGLEPRQVAIWFQNRRARFKTKQLERDYSLLKASYDALQLDYTSLAQHNEALSQKLKQLKSKAGEEINADTSNQSAKEDFTASESENWIQLSDSRSILGDGCQLYQPHLVKIEDHGIFAAEEDSCDFFSVDQAPTLHWYVPDQ